MSTRDVRFVFWFAKTVETTSWTRVTDCPIGGYWEEAKVYRKFGQMFNVNKNWNADIFRHHSRSKKRFGWLFRRHGMFSCLEEPWAFRDCMGWPQDSRCGQEISLDDTWWVEFGSFGAMRSFSSLNLLNLGYYNHHGVDRIRIRVKLFSENMFDHAPQITQLFALWRLGGGPHW